MQNLRFKQNNLKKKPPPRPPPPNFSKYKSRSTYDLSKQDENLIQWSPPSSPKVEEKHTSGGSISSSFSSSTSSLASSKKSFELELTSASPSTWYAQIPNTTTNSVAPTIIRAQVNTRRLQPKIDHNIDVIDSLPMPSVPPPSPPKDVALIEIPYGIALYDFPATHPNDLPLQVNDIVVLLKRINSEWMYGKVADREGMFPVNFIEIQVPLKEDKFYVKALYEFNPQEPGDLKLMPGQRVHVLRQINSEWWYGESNGKTGQFPSTYVERTYEWT